MGSESIMPSILKLKCAVQNYDWGVKGDKSLVSKIYSKNCGEKIEDDKCYAEFWMGTHDSGPSRLEFGLETKMLKSWVFGNFELLGEKIVEKWGGDLPFLFKVLSVGKVLSIQAHPDKELAKSLHKKNPEIYRDTNSKPEMAIAITEFKALCGFVSNEELKDVFSNVPEIIELAGLENANLFLIAKERNEPVEVRDILKSVFTKVMSADNETVSQLVLKLINRLKEDSKLRVRMNPYKSPTTSCQHEYILLNQSRMLNEKEELALLLESQFPGDIGVLSSFFFNYVKLKPGEALYLDANELHAYISGECIECMATSDNVVRAGLTPKYKDLQTLCKMLTYKQGFPEILQGVQINSHVRRYTPPFDEFEVDHCLLPPEISELFPAIPGPSLFIVLSGNGTLIEPTSVNTHDMVIEEGNVLFVPANTEVLICAGAYQHLRMYRAGVNNKVFN